MAQVLKKKHTLKGRAKGPVFRRFNDMGPNPAQFARLARENRTEDMSLADVGAALTSLTGEKVSDLALMAGIADDDVGGLQRLLHCCVMEANEAGQDIDTGTARVSVPLALHLQFL